MGNPLSYNEYLAERDALGNRMHAADERIQECEREGDREWRVGNVRGAKFFEDSARNAEKDLDACAEKIGELDNNFWGREKEESEEHEAGADRGSSREQEQTEKDAGEEATVDAEKSNEVENSL